MQQCENKTKKRRMMKTKQKQKNIGWKLDDDSGIWNRQQESSAAEQTTKTKQNARKDEMNCDKRKQNENAERKHMK